MSAPSARRQRDVIDALRRGTVPANGLDLLAVGLDRFGAAIDDELTSAAEGGAVFKAVRGEYGAGKTFSPAGCKNAPAGSDSPPLRCRSAKPKPR